METNGLKKSLDQLSQLLKKQEAQAKALKATEDAIAKATAELVKLVVKPKQA